MKNVSKDVVQASGSYGARVGLGRAVTGASVLGGSVGRCVAGAPGWPKN